MAKAEEALGIEIQPPIPLAARCARILAGASAKPGIVDAETYRMTYTIRGL
jgi:hypothetical protein